MNENPGETPNPLNNNSEPMPSEGTLDANPSEPLQDVNEPEEIVESVSVEEHESEVEKPEVDTEKPVVDREEPVVDREEPEAEVRKPEIDAEKPEEQATEPSPEPAPEVVEVVEEKIEVNADAPKAVVPPVTNATVESLDPTGRPMEKPAEATDEAKPQKSKKGLVFAIFGCIFLLIGIAAIVAAVMLTQQKSDPVAAAMQKIMSGKTPKNLAIDGDINILINDSSSPIKRLNIDLDSDTVVGSMINTSSAVLTLTDNNNNDYSVEFDEIYVSENDLYFKIDKATALIEDSNLLELLSSQNNANNCTTDVVEVTDCNSELEDCVGAEASNCIVVDGELVPVNSIGTYNMQMIGALVGLVEAVDGKWIRISSDLLEQAGGAYLDTGSNISCITDLVKDVNKNSNSAIDFYNKYPFIKSSDKNVVISKKQNPIFRISVDSKNFTEYINAIQNTELARTLNTCMGWGNNAAVTEGDVNTIVNQMPQIYAEVDSDNNFTRLYLESDINNGAATATIDLGFSYPTNVNISEPVEYTNYEELMQTLFTSMYGNGQTPQVTN